MAAPGDKINLTSPDGGEAFVGGQTIPITWTTTAAGGFIHVGYSIDGGSTWTEIDPVDNRGTIKPVFKWMVPFNVESSTCRIKVVWTDGLGKGATVWDEDESAADFTIAEDHWVEFVDVPDEMTHGKYYPVQWDLFDPDRVIVGQDLSVRVDDGAGWGAWESLGARFEDIEPMWNHIYLTPPEYQDATGQLRIEIKDGAGAVVREALSTEFIINSTLVKVVYPNGGEALVSGETVTIEWRVVRDPGELISGAALHYTTNDGDTWHVITSSTANDYEEDWVVPTGGTSNNVRVKIEIHYLEFSVLGEDESDANFRIIEDRNTLSCTLLDPNPPVTGAFMMGGDAHTIRWQTTGPASEITGFELFYSINSGAAWTRVDQVPSTDRSYSWLVPSIDTLTARFKVSLTTDAGRISGVSNNDFIIYTSATFNVPPVADAGEDQRAPEGSRVTLDGTGSWDRNGDTLTYFWTVVDDYGFNVTINDNTTANPWFETYVDDWCITFVFELEVDDGGDVWDDWPYYTDRVSVTLEPAAPEILNFTPLNGWEGTNLSILVDNAEGATVYFQDVPIFTVPENRTGLRWLIFPLHASVPFGSAPIEVRNLAGSDFTANEFEVHPRPDWCYENGFPWHNQADHFLSYPWDILASGGNYRTTFGSDQIYIPLWICVGIPWYDPWNGLICIGYEIEIATGIPDPLASLYFGSFYCWIGRMGECFGVSTAALKFYNGDLDISDYNGTATRVNQLNHLIDGSIDHYQESMQGSQLSLEILDHYLWEFAQGLLPASEGTLPTGMGKILRDIEEAVDSGELGIITIIDSGSGHAVVPYEVVEVDSTHTRIYVYDCNREYFSWENDTSWIWRNDANNHPPYIEIHKTRPDWIWSFMWPDNTTWSDMRGIVFCPYDLLNGPRTLPTDWEGMISFLAGDVSSTIENEAGERTYWAADGTIQLGIEGLAPLPNFGGLGDDAHGWYSDTWDDYLTTMTGKKDGGVYNWTLFANGSGAYGLEEAGINDGSTDSLDLEFKDGMLLRGRLTYGTTDTSKGYNYVHIKKMGDPASDEGKIRQRVYRVLDATLYGDSTAIINTTDDYHSLVFQNRGPHPITIGVEFQSNVMGSAAYNTSGTPDHLPTARMMDIEIGAYEVVTFTPSNWLDLDNSEIVIIRATPDILPPGQVATFNAVSRLGTAYLTWTPPVDDGGAIIDEYIIWRGPVYNEMNQLTVVRGTERSYVDETVDIDETYFYKIQAVNVAGPGKDSPSVGVWVQQGPASPSVPVNAEAESSKGGVRLSWEPPVDDGGGTITGYQIYRSDTVHQSSPELIGEVDAMSSFTDDTVEANHTYYYFIAAVNEAGPGPMFGPIEIYVPEGSGGGGGGDDDDGGGFPIVDLTIGGLMIAAAVGVGMFLGRRYKKKGLA